MFEDLGLKYVGPIDGHDERLVEAALRRARDFGGPVLVHVITKKGLGYAAAEQNDGRPPAPGRPRPARAAGGTWSRVFGDEMVRDRRAAPRRGRDHRGDAAPDRPGASSPRPTRTGSTTWASRSSTP